MCSDTRLPTPPHHTHTPSQEYADQYMYNEIEGGEEESGGQQQQQQEGADMEQ